MTGSSGVGSEVAAKMTNISRSTQANQTQSLIEGAKKVSEAAQDSGGNAKSVTDKVDISSQAKKLSQMTGGTG